MKNISRRQLAAYVVDELLAGRSASQIAKRAAAELVVSGRTNQAEALVDDIAQQLESRGLAAIATVTSARPLTNSLRQQISLAVKKALGVKQVILNEQVQCSVLAGVRIQTAAHVWDKTAKKILADIRRSN